ncbi:hypothetical protein EVA_15690 [gut metagenome]|uniref:Uncharacterized protein n=1 Tax=gut metagenome TaxID=749906 RepID=J9G9S9_9ZZZZ
MLSTDYQYRISILFSARRHIFLRYVCHQINKSCAPAAPAQSIPADVQYCCHLKQAHQIHIPLPDFPLSRKGAATFRSKVKSFLHRQRFLCIVYKSPAHFRALDCICHCP